MQGSNMTEETAAKTPEWMLLLENKKKRPHRLAHEIGAGAPCLSCGDSCPGLDLHFWRKLCRNCKCKKEEHDVKDDEGYEQFEILFASTGVGKKRRPGAYLNIKVPEASISTSSSAGSVSSNSGAAGNKKGVAFDWVPPDVPEDVAAEYMQQLPPSKLPISGSDGALYRRQQLESQIPLHDLDATKCHGLTADEIQGLQQYLENIKNNVVGQGRVMKLPLLYNEQRLKYSGPTRHQSATTAQASLTGESRPIRIASSQSAQCLKSFPSFPFPRPYAAQHFDKDDPNSFPPPPPDLLQPSESNLDLKTPSAFLPPSHCGSTHQAVPTETQIIASQESHDLAHSLQLPINKIQSSTVLGQATGETVKDKYKLDVQSSTQVHGRYYDPSVGIHGTLFKDINNLSGFTDQPGQVKPQTYARDGTFISDQHAPDIAYSMQLPVGLVSQQSKHLGIQKNSSNPHLGGNEESGRKLQGVPNNETGEDIVVGSKHHGEFPLPGSHPTAQDCKLYTIQKPQDVLYFTSVPGGKPQYSSIQQGSAFTDNGTSGVNTPTNVYSLTVPQPSIECIPSYDNLNNSLPYSNRAIHMSPSAEDRPRNMEISGSGLVHDAKFVPYSASVAGQIAHSAPIAGDSMPKSAHVLHQSHLVQQEEWEPSSLENELSGKLEKIVGLGDGPQVHEEYHLKCHKCNDVLHSGQVAVLAERAEKQAAWHPQCFVCCTCEELLVDLIYFYHKGDVYCGRHYAELLNIPRCFACDELIFVKEYTCAEGKAFHVKHFCCYECDVPLGGKQYIPKDNQPICLQCFEDKYGKSCHTCKRKIAAGDQRVGWKDLSWHVSASCFRCSKCLKSLLGGKFLVKNEQPFCSKECAQSTTYIELK